MKYYFFILFLTLLTVIPKVFAEDTLKIDTKLKHEFDTLYDFPKQTPLILSGNHDMCPSNDCKMIFDKYVDAFIGSGIVLDVQPNLMTLNGYFKLTGSGEDKWIMGLLFKCDTQSETNAESGTTKYVCNEGSGSFLPEDESLGSYNYDFKASFELPSRHFVFNGTNIGTS